MKHSFDDIKIPKKHIRKESEKDAEHIPVHVVPQEKEERRERRERRGAGENDLDARMSFLKPRAHERFIIGEKHSGPRLLVWSAAFFAALVLVFSFFSLFTGATITVTPKQDEGAIEGEFSAYKEVAAGELAFDVMILAKEEGKDIPATKERQVERKASGNIVVYNKHSGAAQPLIKNTRFEAPSGKIYRIKESVSIPGTKVLEGEIVPGSLEVTVYADEPGESYNIGLSDFTIPGFKGSPQYENFYARSKTEMTGGFSGVVKYPSEEDIKVAREELQNTLKEQLMTEANVQKPDNFILYEDGIFISYAGEEKIEETSSNTARVTERATLNGVIFNKDELAKFIAKNALQNRYDGSAVTIPNMDQITFNIVDKESASPFDKSIAFSLSGTVHIIWTVDEEGLKAALVGKPKKGLQFQEVLAAFPYIERAEASIKPFWKRTFPSNVDKIHINQIIK
ncbi:MAG: hypothetical protein NUV42_02240 [Candidatus Yonathbacteria bacterium]|nr:hypothetical protein [Candidatus Yonathbacteria bacterium]